MRTIKSYVADALASGKIASLSDLAIQMRVTPSHLSRILNHTIRVPTLKTLAKMAAVLGVDVDEIERSATDMDKPSDGL